MRYFTLTALILVGLFVLALGPGLAAQPATGELVISNGGGLYGNAVIAMGMYGTITTILPLPAGNVGGVGLNHIGNEELVVIDRMIIGINNGSSRTLTASLSHPAQAVDVDEDNTWVLAAGTAVIGFNPVAGTRTTIATGFQNASAIAWNGTDGSLLVVDSGNGSIYKIARDHTKKVLATVTDVRCLCWNSYTGDFFVAAKNVLYNMTQAGTLTTLEANKPGLLNTTGMFLRSDRTLIVVQGDTSPTGVYAYHGHNGQYNRPYLEAASPSAGINPRGVVVDHYRELWAIKTECRVGQYVDFLVNCPPMKGKTYVAGLSFSHAPGIPVGNYRLHLNLDPLLMLSLTTPSLFKNTGTLDTHGTARVTLAVPDIAAIAGLRIFMGAVFLDPAGKNGIGEASNAFGITIQP